MAVTREQSQILVMDKKTASNRSFRTKARWRAFPDPVNRNRFATNDIEIYLFCCISSRVAFILGGPGDVSRLWHMEQSSL